MILKSYYDGGNQADSRLYDVLTLAGVYGSKDQWIPFESAWKDVLRRHRADYLHTSDAVALQGEFHNEKGWDKTKRNAFITACVKVIEDHIALRISKKSAGRLGLGVCTQTVKLKDYIKARSVKPDLPVVTEICATNALARTLEWGEDIMGANFYHMFFDQGEPYYGHVKDRKDNRKAKKLLPLMGRITSMTEVDMRYTPALQMADLVAWCCSHKQANPRYKWQNRLLSLNWIDDSFDYDRLLNPVQQSIDLVKTWKLPRRKPTI